MLAYVFPPFFSVGGSIRVVKFIKYLVELGWLPVVLTIDDRKEYQTMNKEGSTSLFSDIPPQVKVCRTFAGEPSLSFLEKEKEFGQRNWLSGVIVKLLGGARRWAVRYLFLPDRYVAWLPFALRRGRLIVRTEGIDAIFATCPPNSVALVGVFLKLLTGKRLILDFRDDWIDTPDYYSIPIIPRLIRVCLEKWAVQMADKVILVTAWSIKSFKSRYPYEPEDKFVLIPNGCDLKDFAISREMSKRNHNSPFRIVHAGLLNDSNRWGRSPVTVFQALHCILQEQPEIADKLILAFTGHLPEGFLRTANELGLSDVVKELGHLPREEFVRYLRESDLLLTINFDGFYTLIPGKIYEYWAVGGPPILLLSCPGAAASFVEQHSLGLTVEPSDVAGIQQAILTLYRQSKTGAPPRG